VGDRGGEATTLNNMGAVYSAIGEKVKALEFYEMALPLRRAVGDRGGEATTLNNMGILLWQMGQQQEGMAMVEQALALWIAVRSPNAEIAKETLSQMKAALGP
ncbi:MAG: tetratricopeptide repeat protein, partial [Chloroflexi bacterium]|nr:tetratricopeptide repeat protein [Chloroflexota bacterium]